MMFNDLKIIYEVIETNQLNSISGQAQPDTNQVFNTSSCLEKPYRCPHPKIKFFLYTRRTQEYGEEIDVLNPESLWNSHWNPTHPVKVIIHGQFSAFHFPTKFSVAF